MNLLSQLKRNLCLFAAFIFLSLAGVSAHCAGTNSTPTVAPFELTDQYGASHAISFPRTNLILLTVADQKGAADVNSWILPLKERYSSRIEIMGIADVHKVPPFLRGMVQGRFKKAWTYPIMLDWSGRIAE